MQNMTVPDRHLRRQPVGRFAPSPTGDLHLGNLRTAIKAHDDIRSRQGTFILRIEDTDILRSVPGAEERMIQDLAWLGIAWDEGPGKGEYGPYRQSARFGHYFEALNRLALGGLIYPCTCSRKDLQNAASAPHGAEGPIYPGTCRRALSSAELQDQIHFLRHCNAVGRPLPFNIRLRTDLLPPVSFTDEIHGTLIVDLASVSGDFVLLRRDGLWAYQLACAVDDALMGITRVVRGVDLLPSTGRQVGIIQALGYAAPVYRHIALAADSEGKRLSKRDGSQSLQQLKEKGLSAEEVRALIESLPDVSL